MDIILRIIAIMIAISLAWVTLLVYGIPLGLVLVVGILGIPCQRMMLTSPSRAFDLIAICPESNAKPWKVDEARLASAVCTRWLTWVGWTLTILPTLFLLVAITQSAGDPFGAIVTAVVAAVGATCGGCIAVHFPKWTKNVTINCVRRDLESGVAGLEDAVVLKQLSQEIDNLYTDGLGVAPPRAVDEEFFTNLSTVDVAGFKPHIGKCIRKTRRCIEKLRIAIGVHSDATEQYRRTSIAVNRTGLGSLIAEMDDIFTGLHSEQLYDLLRARRWSDFHEVVCAIQADLNRIEAMASDASAGGRTSWIRPDLDRENALEILGAGPDDSPSEIRERYARLVRQLHPDKNSHLSAREAGKRAERFMRVQEAWEFIKSQMNHA